MIKAINYILDNDAPLSALVGKNKADSKTKVYPVVVPGTEAPPFIATLQSGRIKEGKDCADTYQIQVTVYAGTYDLADQISEAVITALTGAGAGTINGVEFSYMNYTDELDGPFDEQRSLYSKVSVFEGK